ncbi:biotin--[acetyl-CoA-carboxylase] ligase [Undibacterium arcticum]
MGVSIAQTLQQFDVRVALKWPNDVMKDGKKVAGVLIESAAVERHADGQDPAIWAVIGVGLNLAMPDALEAQIGRPVAAATWLAQLDRNILMAALLNGLTETLQQFERDGFKVFVPRWNALHAYAGQGGSRLSIVARCCIRG